MRSCFESRIIRLFTGPTGATSNRSKANPCKSTRLLPRQPPASIAPVKLGARRRPRTTALTLTSSHRSLRRVTAVVLAGGASQRFPPDKLAQLVGEEALLDRALASVPEDFTVVVVGSVRAVARPAIFTSEDPPGGGPAAALVAGLRRALTESSDVIVTLPADMPLGGQAASTLLRRLDIESDAQAVVGIDAGGQEQP